MRCLGAICGAVVLAAPPAAAQPRVTATVASPYIPEGLELRQTEDCRVQSSGRAPDARSVCAPGYGWRLHDAVTGALICPADGYLQSGLDWAFAGPGAVAFREGRRLFTVVLPSGRLTELGPGDLHQFKDTEGLGFSAVVWTLPDDGKTGQAMVLNRDGSLSVPIEGADMRLADDTRGLECRSAVVLAALLAEKLPNARWTKIVRMKQPAAGEDPDLCRTAPLDRLAGLGADGLWRRLDPASFKATGTATFLFYPLKPPSGSEIRPRASV